MKKSNLQIDYLSVNDLKPYERNSRLHQKKDIDAIKQSIRSFGFSDPIGIWGKDNTVVEGHGRLQAAKELGIETVPTIRLDFLTDEERREYGIMHNKTAELSSWDFEMLQEELAELEGLKDFCVDWAIPAAEPVAEEDDYDEPLTTNPTSEVGDVYQLGAHKLVCGDSTDSSVINLLMGGKKADLLLTDPPYNVDYTGGTEERLKIANDSLPDAEFRQFLTAAFTAAKTAIKPGGAFYIWHADSEGLNFRLACREAGLCVRQALIWNKNSLVLGRQDYQWKHEPCLYGWVDGGAHYFCPDRTNTTVIDESEIDIDKLKKTEMRELLHQLLDTKEPTTVINIDKPTRNDLHPTMKPVKLMAKLIGNSSRNGEIVLDTFGGSGSTLIAAEQLGRVCFMTELDPVYVDRIIDRWERFTGQKAVKIDGSTK